MKERAKKRTMKKLVIIVSVLMLSVGLFACSSIDNSSGSVTRADRTSFQSTVKKDFDGTRQSERGKGAFYVLATAGTSEDDAEPDITIPSNVTVDAISNSIIDFDGLNATYSLYIP